MISRTPPTVSVLTTGRIAEQLGEPLHRVQYILRTRPHIRPRATAGKLRIFDLQAVAQIRAELAAIDAAGGQADD